MSAMRMPAALAEIAGAPRFHPGQAGAAGGTEDQPSLRRQVVVDKEMDRWGKLARQAGL